MEKNTAQSSSCYQRLLTAVLVLICFMMLPAGMYGRQSTDIQLSVDAAAVHKGQTVTITLTIPSSRTKKHGMPHLLMKELTAVAGLEKSTVRTIGKDSRIEQVYRMQKVGMHTVQPILQWKKQVMTLDSFSIKVNQPPLSADTRFEWFMAPCTEDASQDFSRVAAVQLEAAECSAIQLESAECSAIQLESAEQGNIRVVQGSSCLLYMTAVFSLSPAEETAQSGIFLHNPPPIAKIECETPDNALLSRLDFSALDDAIPVPVFEEGRFVLAAFEWTPLYTGKQPLPIGKIYFSGARAGGTEQDTAQVSAHTVSRTVLPAETVPAVCFVQRRQQPAVEVQPPSHAAFIAVEHTVLADEDTALHVTDVVSAVQALAACRGKEVRSIYPFRWYAERRKLEAVLQITAPLPVYPRGLWLLCAGAAAAGTAGAIIVVFRKKWLAALAVCIVVLCCSTAAAVFYRKNTAPQGVCFAAGTEIPIRRIPETAGSSLYAVRAGESVLILRNTADWYYITTAEGRTGWIPQENVMRYN